MSQSTSSPYALYAYLAAVTLFVFLALVCGAAGTALLLVCAASQRTARVAGALLAVSCVALDFLFAFSASFERLPITVTVLLSLGSNAAYAPFVAILNSRRYRILFRHLNARDVGKKTDAEDFEASDRAEDGGTSEEGAVHSADEDDDRSREDDDGAELAPVGPAPTVRKVASSPAVGLPSKEQDVVDGSQPSSPPSCSTAGHAHRTRTEARWKRFEVQFRFALRRVVAPQLVLIAVFSVVLIGVLHVALAHGCFCSSPVSFTTWASRALQTPICVPDAACHTYATVGTHCSMVTVVSHYVAGQGVSPDGVEARFQPAASSLPTAPIRQFGTGPGRGVRLVVDRPIGEDRRTVAQIGASGLACGATYDVDVTFYAGTKEIGSRTITIQTLPNHTLGGLPDPGTQDVVVVGGGDLYGGPKGHRMLTQLCNRAGRDVSVLWVGGDIAYANNMRRCYRRWDETLAAMAACTRTDGRTRPLWMTASGNHEGGGYWQTRSRAEREAFYTHYTTYFPNPDYVSDYTLFPAGRHSTPAAPPLFMSSDDSRKGLVDDAVFPSTSSWIGDSTVTFYRAYLGTTAWLVLDSETMFPADAQVEFINDTLSAWHAWQQQGRISKIIVGHHCPGLPTLRAWDDVRAVAVRTHWYPLFVKYNVSLVLEHHDHVYKRTHRLQGAPWEASGLETVAPGQPPSVGMLLTGDGALGVGRSGAKHRWYHAVARSGNAGFVMRIPPSGRGGTMTVYDETDTGIDAFEV